MRNHTLYITMTSMLIALAAVLRLIKHIYFGSFQFINLPAIIAFLAAIMLGWKSGAMVGGSSYIVSDFFLAFPGPWTLTNSLLLGLLAGIAGMIFTHNEIDSTPKVFVVSFLLLFIFDILSSWVLLFWIVGGSWLQTLLLSLLGLFVPLSGGFMFGIGPITELVSSFLIATLAPRILVIFKEVKIK